MFTVKRAIETIPISEIKGIDAMFGKQMKMDLSNVPAKFKKIFDKTREDSFSKLSMEAIYESYELAEIKDDVVNLCNGDSLKSRMLANIFHQSSALVFYVVTLNGYEALDEAEDNMLAKLFLDSWGTAMIECGSVYLKNKISEELTKTGVYSTSPFSPGQHNIPVDLQSVVFKLLKPEDINVTLTDRYMMHPKKTISSIFGIGPSKDEEGLQACDFCERRENCPSAYTGETIAWGN